MRSFLLAGALVASALSLAACDAFDSSAGEARMTVRLTDAPFPFDLADSANVSITRIELLARDAAEDDTTEAEGEDVDDDSADRIILFDAEADGGPLDFNLLDLRDGVTATLVNEFRIPADGDYGQIRVFVGDDARVVFTDGSVYALKLPSAQQSGLKVKLPEYSLEGDGEEIDLLIDFDVEKSFVVRGGAPGSGSFQGFLFKPVLEVESFEIDFRDGSDEEVEESNPDEIGGEG